MFCRGFFGLCGRISFQKGVLVSWVILFSVSLIQFNFRELGIRYIFGIVGVGFGYGFNFVGCGSVGVDVVNFFLQVFFVIYFYVGFVINTLFFIVDFDFLFSCDFMDGRDVFFIFVRDKYWEFFFLRRFKWFTLCMLVELYIQG